MPVSSALPDPAASETREKIERVVEQWRSLPMRESASRPRTSTRLLMQLLGQPDGPDFVHRILDGVIRPESLRAAGRQLELLSRALPENSPWHQRALVSLAGGLALIAPWPIIPGVRRLFRRASTPLLGTFAGVPSHTHIRHSIRRDELLTATLLLPTASGRHAAERAAERYAALLNRVDEIAVPVQQVADSLTPWDYTRTVERAAAQMLPLAADAHRHSVGFVIEVTDLRFAELSVDVGIHLLGLAPLTDAVLTITVPAYSPQASQLIDRVREAARAKEGSGGAPTRIRVDLRTPAPHAVAGLSEWPQLEHAHGSQALRVVRYALTPTPGVSYAVASESVHELAYAAVVAEQAGLPDSPTGAGLTLEPDAHMPIPQPTERYAVTKRATVLEPRDFAAVTDLIQLRLLSQQRATHGEDGPLFFSRWGTSAAEYAPAVTVSGVAAANRARMVALQERGRTSTLGVAEAAAARCVTAEQTERRFASAARTRVALAARPLTAARDDLNEIADVWDIYRGRFCEVLINECGQSLPVADGQVTEAVAAARWYAAHVDLLGEITAAEGEPARVVVIAPPSPFTLGWMAAQVCAALSVGSPAIILITENQGATGARTAAVLIEALLEAGLSAGAVQLAVVDTATSAHRILSHPSADRIIAPATTEWIDTSRLWKPTRRFLLREELPACVVVTETADHTRAVRAIAADAPRSATPITVITVMSESTAGRFTRTLSDAVESLAAADGVQAPQPDYLEAHSFMSAVALVEEAAPLSAAVLHTQDPDELMVWAERVSAAQLGANSRIITEAAAARHCSAEVLQQLHEWTPLHAEPQPIVTVQGVDADVTALIEAARPVLSFEQFDRVRLGALDDERVWNLWASRPRTLRQRPTPVVVRAAESADVGELIRVLAATARAGARPQVSSAHPLPKPLLALLENGFRWASVVCETDDEWEARIPTEEIPRLRFIGDDESLAGTVAATRCADVWFARPSASGVLELAAVTREQRLTPGTDGDVQPHSGALANDS